MLKIFRNIFQPSAEEKRDALIKELSTVSECTKNKETFFKMIDFFSEEMGTYFELRKSEEYSKWNRDHLKPEWVIKMCSDFQILINRFRQGKTPVSLEQVLSKDTYASGHVDYHSKFALYCTELVFKK